MDSMQAYVGTARELTAAELAALVRNPAAATDLFDKIAAQQKELSALIALAGPSQEILDIRKEVLALREEAKADRAAAASERGLAAGEKLRAQQAATEMRNAAEVAKAQILAAAKQDGERIVSLAKTEATAHMAVANGRLAEAAKREAELERREAEAAKQVKQAQELAARAASLQAAYETKLAKLNAVMKEP